MWLWMGEQSCFCLKESGCQKWAILCLLFQQLLLPGLGEEDTGKGPGAEKEEHRAMDGRKPREGSWVLPRWACPGAWN